MYYDIRIIMKTIQALTINSQTNSSLPVNKTAKTLC